METVTDFIFLGSKITVEGDCSHEIKRRLLLGRRAMTNLNNVLKSRHILLANISNSHVQMWELDHKEGGAPKNWCFWSTVWEKTLESPLDCKEIKLVNVKGNQLWIFIGRTAAEPEAPIHWPSDAKSWLTGKDWCRERLRPGGKGVTEDEMVGWHHWLNEHEYVQTPGYDEGKGILPCCSPWDHKELGTTNDWSATTQAQPIFKRFLISRFLLHDSYSLNLQFNLEYIPLPAS